MAKREHYKKLIWKWYIKGEAVMLPNVGLKIKDVLNATFGSTKCRIMLILDKNQEVLLFL